MLLAVATLAQPGELVRVGSLPAEGTVSTHVHFAGPKVAWCTDTYKGYLWHTGDGGLHWRSVPLPASKGGETAFGPVKFGFLDASSAWLGRGDLLYWTANAGATWSRAIQLPIRDADAKGHIDDVEFVSPSTGWLLGERLVQDLRRFNRGMSRGRLGGRPGEISVPVVFRTDDGGMSWQRQDYPDSDNEFGWLEIADRSRALVVELNGLGVTANGGIEWRSAKLDPACVNTKHLHCAWHGSDTWSGTSVHFLSGTRDAWWGNEGDLFHSTNGGETWCQLPSPMYKGDPIVFMQIRFADPLRGWALPRNLGTEPLPPYETRDGVLLHVLAHVGAHWAPLRWRQAAEVPPICGMSVLDAEHVWMSGCDATLYRVLP